MVKVIPALAHVVGRGVLLLVAGPGAEPTMSVRTAFARLALLMLIDQRDDRVASNVAGSAIALRRALRR